MTSLRMLLSLFCTVLALGSFIFFAGLKAAPYWAIQSEVSQVFKQSRSIPLGRGSYLGSYNVAVTPLTAENKMAQICQLYTINPTPYVNLLDRKVWLLPLEGFQFSYDETPQARLWTFAPLGLGALLMVLAVWLFKENEDTRR
jgi:hypothetical protein